MVKEIFTPYITKKGKRIYHPTGGVYHFFIEEFPAKEDKDSINLSKKIG